MGGKTLSVSFSTGTLHTCGTKRSVKLTMQIAEKGYTCSLIFQTMQSIPEGIDRFLQLPLFIHVGTRNSELNPNHLMGSGLMRAGENQMKVLIDGPVADKALANLAGNGAISVSAAFSATHEAYQFKGTYVSHAPCSEEERALQEQLREQLNGYFENMGLPPGFCNVLDFTNSIAITFDVAEVFSQTPGPGAGNKIA